MFNRSRRPSSFGAAVLALALVATILPAAATSVAAAPLSSLTVSELDTATGWSISDGVGSLASVGSPKSSGSGSLRLNYDFTSSGGLAIRPDGTPDALPGLPRRISIDVYGDNTYNTVYLEVMDATGEVLRYWAGNSTTPGWHTLTVDLGATTPIAGTYGDADHRLDLPISFSQIVLWRNNLATASNIYFDRLRYEYESSGLAVSDPPIFVPSAGQSSTLRIGLEDAGAFGLAMTDELGRTRSWSGNGGGSGALVTTPWNGRDDDGVVMRGNVTAALTITRGPTTWRYDLPYFAGLPARTAGQDPAQRGINSFVSEMDTSNRLNAATDMRSMEDAWVGMVREEFEWKRVEPAKGRFEWPKFDQAVEMARAHGIEVLGKLAYGVPWAAGAPPGTAPDDAQYYPPANVNDFANYARAVVHRYKDRVHTWQIWNEQNHAGAWHPAPSAAAYTTLLKAAYAAIKAEDPSAVVVLGGLSTGPDAGFLQGIYNNGGWGSFDVLAMHTYVTGPPDGSAIESWIAEAKSTVSSYGWKPIWITEFGWSSYQGSGAGYMGVTTAQQGSYLARSYEIAVSQGIEGIFWFEFKSRGADGWSRADNYGIVTEARAEKPSYLAFRCVAKSIATGGAGTCGSRQSGLDRYATAAAVSGAAFAPGVPVAYIATGTNFPDALAAAAAAGAQGGPVLLVSAGGIPAATAAELARLRPGRIIVAGGESVVSNDILNAARAYTTGSVIREAGPDRYSTAAAISASAFAPGVPVAYIATGTNFPDALAAAAAAGAQGGPVLLVSAGGIPAATATELARLRPAKIVVAGGTGVVSNEILNQARAYTTGTVIREAGADRYATAASISAAAFAPGVPVAYIATGTNFPDALAAAAAAASRHGPVLLTPSTALPAVVRTELDRLVAGEVIAAGGQSLVPDSVLFAAAY